jgi:hypothetical protein
MPPPIRWSVPTSSRVIGGDVMAWTESWARAAGQMMDAASASAANAGAMRKWFPCLEGQLERGLNVRRGTEMRQSAVLRTTPGHGCGRSRRNTGMATAAAAIAAMPNSRSAVVNPHVNAA